MCVSAGNGGCVWAPRDPFKGSTMYQIKNISMASLERKGKKKERGQQKRDREKMMAVGSKRESLFHSLKHSLA